MVTTCAARVVDDGDNNNDGPRNNERSVANGDANIDDDDTDCDVSVLLDIVNGIASVVAPLTDGDGNLVSANTFSANLTNKAST
jgi:hypothetical protein